MFLYGMSMTQEFLLYESSSIVIMMSKLEMKKICDNSLVMVYGGMVHVYDIVLVFYYPL